MNTEEKCSECGGYTGHSPKCSLMSEDYAKSELARYYDIWLKMETECRKRIEANNVLNQRRILRMKDELMIWKGKFMTVKHENNQLRKKLS